MSENIGDCIHGREFCLECHEKNIPRRPKSIGQAHRIIHQMQHRIETLKATIEQQKAEIEALQNLVTTAQCPCCNGDGAYYDNMGNVSQCQWCYEKDKLIPRCRQLRGIEYE